MTLNTSSFVVFLKFVSELENGEANVKRVFSRECYECWLSTRTLPPKRPEESFRKAITSHCRGVDGRKPFPPHIEAALLKEMRKKEVWPCFRGTKFNIGKRGYQVRGFWEAAADEEHLEANNLVKATISRKRQKASLQAKAGSRFQLQHSLERPRKSAKIEDPSPRHMVHAVPELQHLSHYPSMQAPLQHRSFFQMPVPMSSFAGAYPQMLQTMVPNPLLTQNPQFFMPFAPNQPHHTNPNTGPAQTKLSSPIDILNFLNNINSIPNESKRA